MSAAWVTIALLAPATAAIRAAGPVILGGRELPARLMAVVSLLAPALLAALVITQTFATDDGVQVDARLLGLAAAAVALAARRSVLVVVLTAAAVTAIARAIG